MLYHENNNWNISTKKVKYTQDNKEHEQFIGVESKEWWLELARLHKDINIIEFTDVTSTDEQIARLEEINTLNIGDGYSSILTDYVMNNTFPQEVNHILKDLQNRKANIQQGMELSEREINEIMMGMQISDIEIQVLELQLGGL